MIFFLLIFTFRNYLPIKPGGDNIYEYETHKTIPVTRRNYPPIAPQEGDSFHEL